ncbi:MAG: hypothetical protein WC794_01675 [Candidatus Doudnabacteria bacterium]|jgi:hypothetical protein
MLNLLVGFYQLADEQRRELKTIVTLMFIHFGILIFAQAIIQFVSRSWMSPINSLFGLIWMASGILLIWMQGGVVFDSLVAMYVATDGDSPITGFAHATMRVLIGFFTVESFINICYCVFPFYANAGAFGLLAVSTASYFLFKHMASQGIDWASWIWFPRLNIGIALATCLVSLVISWLG